MTVVSFKEMLGRTMSSVTGETGGSLMKFIGDDGSEFTFYHEQDCCESVSIEDIIGDLVDLVGSPIVTAEEISGDFLGDGFEYNPNGDESFTWTFYRFETVKGTVTVRWFGTSNGYYSESVSYDESVAQRG